MALPAPTLTIRTCPMVPVEAEPSRRIRLAVVVVTRTAVVPGGGQTGGNKVDGAVSESSAPERDLSVQVSGWMLMEAAHTVTR